jgi:N-acetylmuramoyl-L-alanine amidase
VSATLLARAGAALLSAVVLLAAAPGAARTAPAPPAAGLFRRAEADFAALKASTAQQKSRQSYARVLEGYRAVFETHARTKQAELALLRAGELYTLLYRWTRLEADLNRAQNYYQRLIEGYRRSPLVDDAQLAIGYLYLDQYGDPGQAYLKFREVARLAPNGDRAAEAAALVKKLARHAPPEPPPAPPGSFELACPTPSAPPAPAAKPPAPAPPPGPPAAHAPAPPAAGTPGGAASAIARIKGIRHWSNPEYTRVVIDLDQPTNFFANLLEDRTGEGRAPRLYLDLFASRVDDRSCQPIPVNDGLLLTIRAGQYTAESVRVVLDIDRLRTYRIFSMENPFRVVVDITGGTDAPPAAAAPPPPAETPEPGAPEAAVAASPAAPASPPAPQPAPTRRLAVPPPPVVEDVPFPTLAILPSADPVLTGTVATSTTPRRDPAPAPAAGTAVPPAPVPAAPAAPAAARTAPAGGQRPPAAPPLPAAAKLSLAQQLGLGVRRVVIDAGHGAHDPGAIGVGGLQEKDVTLDLALRVRDLLRQEGFETFLTRDRDVYLPLEERTARANTERGDLFLSLHCNSSDAGNLNGVETYFLNLASSRRAMATAARENSMSVARMSDLEHILRAIFASKMDESSRFAEMVQKSLTKAIRKRYRDVKDLGVKQAPFYVLIGAEMPSILAEVSFINHRVEGRRLADDAYRQVIAAAIADGVKRYSKSVKVAAIPAGVPTP